MPRHVRNAPGGFVYHVLNRSNGRRRLFAADADYVAFLQVLKEAMERERRREPLELFAFCVMPNHWHLVLRPSQDGQLSRFMSWLAQTHTQRWRHAKRTVGEGALYQGRFKSFIVQEDAHFVTVCRYVERNAVRPSLVSRAEAWPWGSAAARGGTHKELKALLSPWPLPRPRNWTALLNQPLKEAERGRLLTSMDRSRPLGNDDWTAGMVRRLDLGHTLRNPGRPRKAMAGSENNGDARRITGTQSVS